jgi:hypothetical protein
VIGPLEYPKLTLAYPREGRSRDQTFCEKREQVEQLENLVEIVGMRLAGFSRAPGSRLT